MKVAALLGLIGLVAAIASCSSDVTSQAPVYGSYVVICNESSSNVTFVNFPLYGCEGTPTIFSEPLNQCYPELAVFSWNGFCNSTNMWYNNFASQDCTGPSALSRWYVTYKCENCPNAECKNGRDGVHRGRAV